MVVTADASEIAVWLFTNAEAMTVEMFFDPEADWQQFHAYHILAMRAATRSNVFTKPGKAGYLASVRDNPELAEIADAIFSDDYGFITSLGDDWTPVKPALIQLMQLAYRQHIRVADARVKAM